MWCMRISQLLLAVGRSQGGCKEEHAKPQRFEDPGEEKSPDYRRSICGFECGKGMSSSSKITLRFSFTGVDRGPMRNSREFSRFVCQI
jgi:hypothetical protein